jgi:outer membrane receptor protein involved in Fe transport
LAAPLAIFAQGRGAIDQDKLERLKNMRVGVIKGKIMDNDDDSPLEMANILVHRKKDSSLVSGAIAKEDGSFVVDKLPFGAFYVKVKFIGYEDKIIERVLVLPKKRNVDIGEIRLTPKSVTTDEVEVTAEREHVEYKVDRKIINIDNDALSAGGTAAEALERAPSVNVDIEGNVTLRGSSNYTVFVNGKPSVLQGSDALQQIPAAQIKQIELITNPSAKYDPDGLAGIINIVLKEKTLKGFGGISSLSVGANDKYRFNVKTNAGVGDFNLTLGANYNQSYFFGNGDFERQTFIDDTTFYLLTDANGRFNHSGYSIDAGVEYNITRDFSMQFRGGYGTFEFERNHHGNSHNYTDMDLFDYYSSSKSILNRTSDYYNLNYDIHYLIDDLGQKLNFLARYSKSDDGGGDFQRQLLTDANHNKSDQALSGVDSEEYGTDEKVRLQLDYTLPYSENTKFEAGLQTRIDAEKEDFDLNMLDTATGRWEFNERFSNAMNFDRSIYAGYMQFASNLLSIDYQLGLRAEYTRRKIEVEKDDKEYEIDRVDWFPTLHLSRKLGDSYQLMAGYSRRIHRPRGYYLDPFPSYRDQYTYHVGNPELEPEYTDSYELGMQKYFGKSWVSAEVYYRKTTNEFERYAELDSNGIMIRRIANLGSEESMGIEMSLNYKPWDWVNLNLVGNYYRYTIAGDIVAEGANTSTDSWHMRMFADFRIIDELKLQIMGFYRGPTITSQGEREGMYMLNSGLKYEMFDRALSFTLSFDDMLGTRDRVFTQTGPGFRTYNSFNRESQIIRLNINYKFNNYQDKRRREQMEQQDMEMDMEMY